MGSKVWSSSAVSVPVRSKFKLFSHTADIGLRVWGRNRADLLENAAMGLMTLLSDPGTFSPVKKESFQIKSSGWESLLVDWLEEILYRVTVKKIGFFKFDVISIKQTKDFIVLEARGYGEPLDFSKHRVLREIKAVTYGSLEIKKAGTGYSTKIIFDV